MAGLSETIGWIFALSKELNGTCATALLSPKKRIKRAIKGKMIFFNLVIDFGVKGKKTQSHLLKKATFRPKDFMWLSD